MKPHPAQRAPAVLALLLLVATWPSMAPAQMGVTNVYTTVTSLTTASATGTNSALIVTNGGILTSTAGGRVGYYAAAGQLALNNFALVSDPGSVWSNTTLTSFYVGRQAVLSTLVISNGGMLVTFGDNLVGYDATAWSNRVVITGSGSLWDQGRSLMFGESGSYNQMIVRDGGRFVSGSSVNNPPLYIGRQAGANSNEVWVLDGGNIELKAGGSLQVGSAAGANGNRLVVSGTGASVSNSGRLYLGNGGLENVLVVSNGGYLLTAGLDLGLNAASAGNFALITGTNSMLVTTSTVSGVGLNVGNAGSFNTMVVSNGARVTVNQAIQVGVAGFSSNNFLLVSGAGTIVSNAGNVNVGPTNLNSLLLVNDGGTLVGANIRVGHQLLASGSVLRATGPGSLVRATAILGVGSNAETATSKGSLGTAIVEDGATFEIGSKLYAGYGTSGTISNRSGIFQFTTAAPDIQPGVYGNLVMTNGTISYRGVAAADILSRRVTTNIVMQGNSGFRLVDATNASGLAAYTFDSTGVSTNFQRLELAGANSQWRSGVLTIGAGGELTTSNSTGASIAALVTNAGTIRVYDSILTYLSNVVLNGGAFLTQRGTNVFTQGLSLAGNSTFTFTNGTSRMTGVVSNNSGSTIQAINSIVTWQDAVVIGGRYYSDPSTNIFATNVTVTASGSIYGSNGDLFVFMRDFANQSTNSAQFSLSSAAVLFTNSPTHLLNLSNGGSVFIGQGFTNFSQVATNYAIGQLGIASGDRLTLAGNKDAITNALYVGWLDIQGIDTNSFDSVTNSLFAALNLPNINLYYDKYDLRNDWLNANLVGVAAGGYNLWGGGLLLPIPEPASVAALGLGLAALALARRRKG